MLPLNRVLFFFLLQHFLQTRHCPGHFAYFASFYSDNSPIKQSLYYYLPCTHGETEAQRGMVTWPIHPCLGGSRTHFFSFYCISGPQRAPQVAPPALSDVCPLYSILDQWSSDLFLVYLQGQGTHPCLVHSFPRSVSINTEGFLIVHLAQSRT